MELIRVGTRAIAGMVGVRELCRMGCQGCSICQSGLDALGLWLIAREAGRYDAMLQDIERPCSLKDTLGWAMDKCNDTFSPRRWHSSCRYGAVASGIILIGDHERLCWLKGAQS